MSTGGGSPVRQHATKCDTRRFTRLNTSPRRESRTGSLVILRWRPRLLADEPGRSAKASSGAQQVAGRVVSSQSDLHRVSSTTAQASISTLEPSGRADVANAVRAGNREPKNSA